jgi:hypothetical protein
LKRSGFFMLDSSLALGLRNQSVWAVSGGGIAHKEEWIHGVGARASIFLRSRSFCKQRFLSPRCASAIQIVRPLESIAETQPQLNPALLRLSAMISQSFTRFDSASFALQTAMTKVGGL